MIFAIGNILDLSIPSFTGMLWRTAVLAAATIAGGVAAAIVPFPFAGLLVPSVFAAIVLIVLFDMEFPEELGSVMIFLVAYALAQFLIQFVLVLTVGSFFE